MIGKIREFADRVADGLEHADWVTRRAIIRAVVKRVEIDAEEVRIIYKISPDPVGENHRDKSLQHCCGRDFPAAVQHLPALCVEPVVQSQSSDAVSRRGVLLSLRR